MCHMSWANTVRSRVDFSRWTIESPLVVETLLGHLEQGHLLSVTKGVVSRISYGIDADGNWVSLQGKSKPQARAQESSYLITDKNIFRGKVVKTEGGEFVVSVEVPLLPDLRPKDNIDVHWSGLGTHSMQITKPNSVKHIVTPNNIVTRFAFVVKI